ncbi:hypothetical protein ES703_34520 [subsurface metagenome]
MIDDNVYFGKGKIKGIAMISKKYWDEGNLSTDENNLHFKGNKGSAILAKSQVKSVEMVRRRRFKVIRITMQTDEFYHICAVSDFTYQGYTYEDPDEEFSSIEADVKLKNKGLFKTINKFLNL